MKLARRNCGRDRKIRVRAAGASGFARRLRQPQSDARRAFLRAARGKTGWNRFVTRRHGARRDCGGERHIRGSPDLPPDIAWIELLPAHERRGACARRREFLRTPGDALKLVGVTGTNGKTTTTFLVDSILHAAGLTTGLDRHHRLPHAAGQPLRRRTPRRNRSTCSKCSPKCATRAARTPCWKQVRMRWRWTGSGAAISPWRFSRISRATISTITRPSKNISPRSARSLKAPARARPTSR